MAEFAKMISDLLLYQELDRAAGRDSIDATEVARLKGLVTEVADTVGPALAQIPVTFCQYTVHDIRHCRNVIARMGDIVPAETREKLNALEISFLLLSALLHDVGMVVSDHEKTETLLSGGFRRFKEEGHTDRSKAIEEARSAGNEPRAQAIEDALLAEYYRRLHPERVRQFMDRLIAGKLRYREADFADDLACLCQSHAWGVEESNDARHPEKAVARLDDNVRLYGVRVNLQYLACILRISDILDFDRSRTPLAVFQHIDFTEDKSWEEWNKHLQVKGWDITEKQVAFDIPCTHPVFYVGVHEFLGWIDDELRECRHLVENKPQLTADRYKLFLPQVVDRHKVRMADPSYLAGAFRFQLEYENILALLMDKSLYPDPSLFLRELLQNALDACRRKEAAMELAGLKKLYKPRIEVWDWSGDPNAPRITFQDNGIGMSQRIVEQYFLRIGRSYYRSPEFDAERQRLQKIGKELDACSQFGIGILSCFLVGDHFQVDTYQEGGDTLQILIEGPARYFVIRRTRTEEQAALPSQTGTRITVHIRPKESVNVRKTLATFAVNSDYPIYIYEGDVNKPHIIKSLLWERPVAAHDFIFSTINSSITQYLYDDRGFATKLAGLRDALVASCIPFDSWSFSSHIRGRSWFWLLRGQGDIPVPQIGFLEVGEQLSLAGIASVISRIDMAADETWWSYEEWSVKLRQMASREEDNISETMDSILSSWKALSDVDKERLDEVIMRRSKVHGHLEKRLDWIEEPRMLEALMRGTTEWADWPGRLWPHQIGNWDLEERIALHSILLPAGVVQWSPDKGTSSRLRMLPMFGGLRIDIRGSQAPRPAAHRLFVLADEADELRQIYLRSAMLHGVDLVRKYGVGDDRWRDWLGELLHKVRILGLNVRPVIKMYGEAIERSCGLAVLWEGEKIILVRAQVGELFKGPVPIVRYYEEGPGLIMHDPVNRFLMDHSAKIDWKKPVEADLSTVPFRLKQAKSARSR